MTQDPAALLARIEGIAPGVDLGGAVVNVDGLVNIAILAGGNVYRFARNEAAIHDMQREIRVLELVRRFVEMPVPAFEVIERDFVRYPLIEGQPLFRNDILRLPEAEQDALAETMARFLRQLHTIPASVLAESAIEPSGGRQTRDQWLAFYEAVRAELFPLMYRSTRQWVEAHFAPVLDSREPLHYTPVLIHDDLAQYHILFDPARRRINGVIDFGTAGLGDPASDYGILINVYGERFVRRMAHYDGRIALLIDRARFYAGTFELQWVLGGVRSGSADWFTAHLDRARDVLPYGQPL